jgi:uncharacterized protein with ParB-like and HNH nuclease domain/predicted transport protein
MKAKEAPLIKLLQNDAQFVIPIYQRTYSWTVAQCRQLWDDIVQAAKSDSTGGHFIGSIVYIGDPGPVSNVDRLMVIDGQQRLTSLTLLLIALRNLIRASVDESEIKLKTIEDYYLFNQAEDGQERYKILLTQNDRQTLMALADQTPLPSQASHRIMENFTYFERQLNSGAIGLGELHAGIKRLLVVDVALDPHHDNPQLIFESLNSTGLALTQADLIRNYVLMGLSPKDQENLYTNYWRKMEERFGQDHYAEQFDAFMRHYLTIKLGRIPRLSEVYAEFKTQARQSDVPIQHLIEDLYKFSEYYARIALGHEPDGELNAAFRDISTLRVDTAYPFLLEAYDDYSRGRLSQKDFVEIARLVESYVLRRAICGIPTNSLNKTFLTLSSRIDKDRYLESAKAAFLLMDSFRRFPRDEEFTSEFELRDIYSLTNRRTYILSRLENFGRKESVNVEEYTIEHIMPQNSDLSAGWQADLGADWKAVQSKYLHTIGNLTLTGYNPELSDHTFMEKRDMPGGFRDSPIRLNADLATLTMWNESEIQVRANRLAKIAIKSWPAPNMDPSVLAAYRSEKRVARSGDATLAEHPGLVGAVKELFEDLRRQILNLDPDVYEEVLIYYIAYKFDTNFVDIAPRTDYLVIALNMGFEEIDDPQGVCRDMTGIGHHGNGDVEFRLRPDDSREYAMHLIRQSFDRQTSAGDE